MKHGSASLKLGSLHAQSMAGGAAAVADPAPQSISVRPEGELARGTLDTPAWAVSLVGGAGVLLGLGFLGWQWRARWRAQRRRLTR